MEIFADIEKRLDRIQKRRENPDDATKTMEQFLAAHQRSTEMSIPEVVLYATKKIDNNGDTSDLRKQLDELVKKHSK